MKRMKKTAAVLLCIVLSVVLCSCGGNIRNVKITEVSSELYSQEDIDAAIKVIEQLFSKDWSGCTLTKISYASDQTSRDYQAWADRNNADEAIVLISSFDVDSSGGDGPLNPNSTYDGWMWILVRSDGGEWRHVDHGY